MTSFRSVWASGPSRTLFRSLLFVSCALVFSGVSAAWYPSASVDLPPTLNATGASVLDISFSSGGWAPEVEVLNVAIGTDIVPVLDHSQQYLAILAAMRLQVSLLWQLLFLGVVWSVAALALFSFKGYNHIIGYHGSARK